MSLSIPTIFDPKALYDQHAARWVLLAVAFRQNPNQSVFLLSVSARGAFWARLADQFDAVLHFDETQAVEPLERSAEWETGEVPETFPFAV